MVRCSVGVDGDVLFAIACGCFFFSEVSLLYRYVHTFPIESSAIVNHFQCYIYLFIY